MAAVNPALQSWLNTLNDMLDTLPDRGLNAPCQAVADNFSRMNKKYVTQIPGIAHINDLSIARNNAPPVPVRLYDPALDATKPVMIFMHGGGHMCGSVDVYDPIARKLAQHSGRLVVSVEYRLTPDHPYPQGLEDCLHVARQIWPLLDSTNCLYQKRLAIVGDSGGGALAATLSALSQQDDSLHFDEQVLIYPSLDYTQSFPSIDNNGRGYLLEKERIAWYFDHYLQHGEDRHSTSALWMPITHALPDTLVISCGFCPLRDENFAYEKALRQANVPCEHIHFPDMIHAFLNLEDLVPQACNQTYEQIARFLNSTKNKD